jgi:N-acetylglucosaminyldiphosphoundecaprenol N-acetyl-beta-D-mannosaminyltransferase
VVKDRECTSVLGMYVDAISLENTLSEISNWIRAGESKYICVSNVHMCMEAYDDINYRKIVNEADLVVPDGKPIVVAARMLSGLTYEHIRGADLTRALLNKSHESGLRIGFYGGTSSALARMIEYVNANYSNIDVVSSISPPFRDLTEEEDKKYTDELNKSRVQILFIGLGCPKQEKWMAKHRGEIDSIMIGVGAVFDFLSGTKKEAPLWMQRLGLEWLFRLISEPRRLWKRYLYYNTRFVLNFFVQYKSGRMGVK